MPETAILVPADLKITVQLSTKMQLPPVPPTAASAHYYTSVTLKCSSGLKLRIFKPNSAFADVDGRVEKHPMVCVKHGSNNVINFPWVQFSSIVQWGYVLAVPTHEAFAENLLQPMMTAAQREANVRRFVITQHPMHLAITYNSTSNNRDVSVEIWKTDDPGAKVKLNAAEFGDLQFSVEHRKEISNIVCVGYDVCPASVISIGV